MSALVATYRPARVDPQLRLPWPIWLFIASMIVPADLAFEVAGLNLSPQRIVLLGFAGGVAIWYLRERRLEWHDRIMILAGGWAFLSTMVNMPLAGAVERGGAFVLETTVAYFLPTAFLVSPAQVRLLIRGFFGVIAVLAPLAAIEAFESFHYIAIAAAELMERPEPFEADTRLGLLRARVTFAHQILFGVFCASLLAFLWYEAQCLRVRLFRAGTCFAAVFFSLSSAAILLFLLQAGMIVLERFSRHIRHRGALAAGAIAAAWIVIELAVRGGMAGFVTRYLSLNPSTGAYRQLIWLHVTDDIEAHRWFGTGGAWTRLSWMVESIDHVYFAKAIAYGIPPILLIVVAGVTIARGLFRMEPVAAPAWFARMRLAWVFAVIGLAVAGLTVDYFGRALPFVMFILGLGAALIRMAGRGPRAGGAP